jgi:hypothetical protein
MAVQPDGSAASKGRIDHNGRAETLCGGRAGRGQGRSDTLCMARRARAAADINDRRQGYAAQTLCSARGFLYPDAQRPIFTDD